MLADLIMPKMGDASSEAWVEEWKKAPGDWVETGELICIVSIDKAAFDYESPYDGKLVEILVPVSAIVSPGTPIARIDVVHESE